MSQTENNRTTPARIWNKYQIDLLSFILSLYALPVSFYYFIFKDLDGGWNRALNIAIRDNRIFGSEVVFTFGPLAYLSTRNTEYIKDIYVLLFDVFITTCLFLIFKKYLQANKRYFIVLLLSLLYFKGCEGSMLLFLLFTLYASMNLKEGFTNYLHVGIMAISGVVVFFMKINFGLITLPLMVMIALYLLFKNRKMAIYFAAFSSVLFLGICFKTKIDVLSYVHYGSIMISHYGEAMQLPLPPSQANYVWALMTCSVFGLLLCYSMWRRITERKLTIEHLAIYGMLMLNMFLVYKNSFTRNDGHNEIIFGYMPFFMAMTLWVLDRTKGVVPAMAMAFVFVATDANITLPHGNEGKSFLYNAFLAPNVNYAKNFFRKQENTIDTTLVIPADKKAMIGNASIDIFPVDVAVMQQNDMNYYPRPTIQSYAAYSPELDSVNAKHFFRKNRPEWVMHWTWSIDNRYPMWDEPLTSAMLRMNYDYAGYVATRAAATMNEHGYYLLLKNRHSLEKYPEFVKVYSIEKNITDTVHFSFPTDTPYYMTAELDYSTAGKLNNIFFQPASIQISFLLADTLKPAVESFKIIKPMIDHPVLINKLIMANSHYINFITGHLENNRNIGGFVLQTKEKDFTEKVRYTFYRMKNYF